MGKSGRGAGGGLVGGHHREVAVKSLRAGKEGIGHLAQAGAAGPGPEGEARGVRVAAEKLFVQRINLAVDLVVAGARLGDWCKIADAAAGRPP